MRERADAIARTLTHGAGQAARPRPRPRCCTRPTPSSGSPRKASGPTARSSRRRTSAKRHYAIKHPVGVVGTISPWNFPITLPSRKIAPALAAGCTIVSKPADQTPLRLIQVFECLVDAGLPAGRRQPRDRPRQADRRRVPREPGRAQDQLHRLDRGRQGADPPLGRPGEAAQPGTRRPRPVHRLPRRRLAEVGARPPSSASSATTARSASPRPGSTSTRRSEEVHRGGRRADQEAEDRQRPGRRRRGRPDVRDEGAGQDRRPDRRRPQPRRQDPDRRRPLDPVRQGLLLRADRPPRGRRRDADHDRGAVRPGDAAARFLASSTT